MRLPRGLTGFDLAFVSPRPTADQPWPFTHREEPVNPLGCEELVEPARWAQANGPYVQLQVLERPACGEVVASAHHRPVDPVYALLRRAVCDADRDAWANLADTFRGLVLSTIRGKPWSYQTASDDDWVYRSLQRFWQAVTPARFGEFPDAPSLARYLKPCAASAYLDAVRDQRRHATLDLDQVDPAALSSADLEAELLDQQAGQALWTTILDLLNDDTERTLAYLSPRQAGCHGPLHLRRYRSPGGS